MCALALLLSLTACQAPGPDDSTPTPSPSPTPVNGVDALYGDDALFLSEFIERFPNRAPADLLASRTLFESGGTGPATYDLPTPQGTDPLLVLVVFCEADTSYEVAIMRDDKVVDHTWGDSCPQTGLRYYTTAPISGPLSNLQTRVTVDPRVSFRVSILQSVQNRP